MSLHRKLEESMRRRHRSMPIGGFFSLGLSVPLFLAAAGCGHPDDSPAWTIKVGAQGGFTGGGSGHLIHSDGTVEEWSQVVPGDSVTVKRIGRADGKSVRALQEAATTPEMVALGLHETGNMTAFLEWNQGPESRRYSWAERGTEPELPPPLQKTYAAAQGVVRSAQRH